MNYYTLLNVDKRASVDVIQAAFKVLAVQHHPDHNGNPNIFKELINARDTLTDSKRRKIYDQELSNAIDPNKPLIKDYEVLKFIAEGAMGRTYIVRHKLIKKLACLKACLAVGPEYEQVMLNEASAIWDIRHYAFPAIRDVFHLEDGALAIVMSYVPGPTLDQCVKHVGPIDPEHCSWIFDRLLAGLNYLHANGVVHGDIKPQNIIIQPERHSAVLIDFGLSMVKPTKKDHNIGYTEYFSPPEQLAKERKPLIPETDLYSLGMSMLYTLNGKMLAKGDPWPKMPIPLKNFLLKLINLDINLRPNWQKSNLLDDFRNVRISCFGTNNSKGKKFPNVPFDTIT